jgi:protein-S-isoprenylcysteine O-methyltransferase Ste14
MVKDPARHPTDDPGTAGVIARPPLIFLTALLLGLLLDRLLPFAFPDPGRAHWIVGSSAIAVGLGLAAAGIGNFSRAATPVPSNQPVRSLVATGIHGRTRNPIYLGMFLIYAGIGLAARSPGTYIFLLPLAFTIRYGVVAREEAYLERRFGDAYREYKARVRRWL